MLSSVNFNCESVQNAGILCFSVGEKHVVYLIKNKNVTLVNNFRFKCSLLTT